MIALLALASPALARAQTPAGRHIEAARAQLDALNADSAISLLHYAVDPRTGAGLAERLRGYVLLGIADLINGQKSEARAALREALTLDPELRIDSLADLSSELVSTFNAERASLVRARGLSLVLEVPSDTLVPVQDGGYQVVVLPTRRSQVVLTVAADSGGAVVYADSETVSGVTTFGWSLHGTDGALIEPGRYTLRVSASDSSGESAAPVERLLTIDREQLDTLLLPGPIPATALAPESVHVHQRSRLSLVRGVGFGLAGGALAYLGAGPSGVKDGRAFVVGGTLALGGLLGFLLGRRATLPNPAAIEQNRHLHETDARSREAITQSNARARARARIRIRTASLAP